MNISFRQVLTSLMKTIDLVSFFVRNHHQRVASMSYNLGNAMGWPDEKIKRLVVAASLHDIGAISIHERDQLIQMDVTNPHPHSILGAMMLRPFAQFAEISEIIRYHHCRWNDGAGRFHKGREIPEESFLLHLADRVDILIDPEEWILDQVPRIRSEIFSYRGTLFNDEMLEAFEICSRKEQFWLDAVDQSLEVTLGEVMSGDNDCFMDLKELEALAYTFSRVIDFRSKFTATHSCGVAAVARELGRLSGKSELTCGKLRVAGYLHDVGKIAIPVEILDKPAGLTAREFNQVKAHSYYTHSILRNIKGISDICQWASMHHERHNGSGYPFKIDSLSFTDEMDIVMLSDMFTALTEDRPYRKGMDKDTVLGVLSNQGSGTINSHLFHLMKKNYAHINRVREQSQGSAIKEYQAACVAQ